MPVVVLVSLDPRGPKAEEDPRGRLVQLVTLALMAALVSQVPMAAQELLETQGRREQLEDQEVQDL